MATVNFVNRPKSQSGGGMGGVLKYVQRDEKTMHNGKKLVSGLNCSPQSVYHEFMSTKLQYGKDSGMMYYHMVQSFHPDEKITPETAHEIAMKLAEHYKDFEVLVATHSDCEHIHSHFIINSVSFETGKKLHQKADVIDQIRKKSDALCRQYGLSVCQPNQSRVKSMNAAEFHTAQKGESWKFTLIKAIDDALCYSDSKETFIQNMEYEGYQVNWTDTRKHITYTTPEGYKCRDNKLFDETYLKENLEKLFEYRNMYGFTPQTPEPEGGWLSEIYPMTGIATELVHLGKNIEDMSEDAPVHTPYIHTESKQRQRERIKALAQGHKLQSEEQSHSQGYSW